MAGTMIWYLAGITAGAQSSQPVSFPTGLRPQGIAVIGEAYVVVANSGDNSVSIYRLDTNSRTFRLELVKVVTGIPSPYGVAACFDRALVTSPDDNSVRLIQVPEGQVTSTFTTGLRPYVGACYSQAFGQQRFAAISNWGESSLTLINLLTAQTGQTIPGVPGARGFHGVGFRTNSLGIAFVAVAGTDGNLVTELSGTGSILRQIPIQRPISAFVTTNAGSLQVFGSEGSALVATTVSEVNSNELVVERSAIYSNVSSPKDVIQGVYATTGDSVWRSSDASTTTIPGATGIAFVQVGPSATSDLQIAYFVTSVSTNRVFILYGQGSPPIAADFAVQSAASAQGVAPGGLASAYLSSTGVAQAQSATNLPLPTSLGGISMLLGGIWKFDWLTNQWSASAEGAFPAPLLFVGPNQINFQVPSQIGLGFRLAQIRRPDGSSLLGTLDVQPVAPAIFTTSQNGQGQAAALNQNNTPNSVNNPAPRGSALQVFLTGAGLTNPMIESGQAANPTGNPLVLTLTQPSATISGQPARVLFSGMAPGFVGLWQINIEIPATAPTGPPVPLMITSDGRRSNLVTIAVQ